MALLIGFQGSWVVGRPGQLEEDGPELEGDAQEATSASPSAWLPWVPDSVEAMLPGPPGHERAEWASLWQESAGGVSYSSDGWSELEQCNCSADSWRAGRPLNPGA